MRRDYLDLFLTFFIHLPALLSTAFQHERKAKAKAKKWRLAGSITLTLLAYINELGIELYNWIASAASSADDELLGAGSSMRVYRGHLVQNPTAPPIPVALKVPDSPECSEQQDIHYSCRGPPGNPDDEEL